MRKRWLLLGMVVFGVNAAPPAQVRKKIPEPKIERKWEVDADGLRQWKELKPTACPLCRGQKTTPCPCKETKVPVCAACKGKQKATCRVCAGSGEMFDPLVELICPYCQGTGFYGCGLCGAHGSISVQGSGQLKCPACKKKGSFKCGACKGKRHVPVLKVGKKGPASATVAQLKSAREVLQAALKKLETFEPGENESKTFKAIGKIVDRPAKVLPVLKPAKALLKDALKGVRKGTQWTSYPERLRNQFVMFQDQTRYLLMHQILLIDKCLERAEHNEKVLAAKKG